ncbi:MAG: ABC transporter permease [Candidatus Anammoxibacter sp.]
MNQISAIAWLTLKENIRSKVFLILLFTGTAVTTVSILFPVIGGVEEKVMLVESMCLKSITFFGMIIAAILSAASIPKDVEDKSIYSIITKPVSRLNLVLGKILGFVYIIGMTTAFLGCFSVLLIRNTASKGLQTDNITEDFGDNNNVNEAIKVFSQVDTDSMFKARKQMSLVEFSINGEYNVTPGGTKWIEGGKGTAVWTISGLNEINKGKYLEFEIDPNIDGADTFIPLEVNFINPETDVKETRLIDAMIGEKLILQIDSRFVKGSDLLLMGISPMNPGHYFGAKKESVKMFYNYNRFEYNFLKAITIIFLQIVLIIFIGVTASTFFKTPAVSIFFILFIFLCGFMVDYLKDFGTVINISDLHDHNHDHELAVVGQVPSMFITFLNSVFRNMFSLLTLVIPNFNKFNMESFILNRIDIPIRNMFTLFGYAAIYCMLCVGISIAAVRTREI